MSQMFETNIGALLSNVQTQTQSNGFDIGALEVRVDLLDREHEKHEQQIAELRSETAQLRGMIAQLYEKLQALEAKS